MDEAMKVEADGVLDDGVLQGQPQQTRYQIWWVPSLYYSLNSHVSSLQLYMYILYLAIHSSRFPTPPSSLSPLFALLRLRTVNCNWQSCIGLAWALALGLLELVPDGWCRHQPTDPPWNETRAREREEKIIICNHLLKRVFFWLNLNSIARKSNERASN